MKTTLTRHTTGRPDALREYVSRRARETGRLVMIYSNAPWGIGGGAQPPQAHADVLAAEAAVVFTSWNNPSFDSPVESGAVVRHSNELPHWLALGAKRRFLYAGSADKIAVDAVRQGNDLGWTTAYYCFDDWGNWEWARAEWYDESNEAALVREASMVLCTAKLLVQRLGRFSDRPDMHHLPNSSRIVGLPWASGPRTVDCVCVGWLADTWPDWGLFEAVAQEHSLRIIGKLPAQQPFSHPNVEWVGEVAYHELMPLLSTARVGIIPFRDIPLVHAVDPIKYYDYLAAGLPTVASYMPELQGRPFVEVAYSPADFVAAVGRALKSRRSREKMRTEARAHTAECRVQEMTAWLKELGAW